MVYLENEYLKAAFSKKGAELLSLFDKNRQTEIMYRQEGGYWEYSSPILFPIVGSCFEDKYIYGGKVYHMLQHGFARRSDFELISSCETSACFMLSQNPQTLTQYPFNFKLTAEYTLEGSSCVVSLKAENTGDREMPFQIGYHPAFRFNLSDIDDCYVLFEKEESDFPYLTDGKRLNIRSIPKTGKSTYSKENPNSSYVNLITQDYKIKIDIKDFIKLAVWRKTEDSPFVSIEPLMGGFDSKDTVKDIFDRPGRIVLKQGEQFKVMTCISSE